MDYREVALVEVSLQNRGSTKYYIGQTIDRAKDFESILLHDISNHVNNV